MNKYKDSFETRSESLEQGGKGIMTAVRNEDASSKRVKTREGKPYPIPKKGSSAISPIRTLADDLEQSVQDSHITLSRQALEKGGGQKKLSSVERGPEVNQRTKRHRREAFAKQKRIPSSVVFLFFTLIVFGTSLYLFISRQEIELGAINLPQISSFFSEETSTDSRPPMLLVQTDEIRELMLTPRMGRAEVRQLLNKESEAAQTGTLIALAMNESFETESGTETRTADITSFLNILDISTSNTLGRNTNEYTLGISGGGEARAFLVARIISYEEIFGALLAWENAMPRELYGLFHNNVSVATSNTPLLFSDIIVDDLDARVLTYVQRAQNEEGESLNNSEDVLIYSIINKEILIITHSREELARIVSRLQ